MHFLNNFFNKLKDSFTASKCEQPTDFMDTSFNIAIHVAILFLILSLFFTFYIAKLEEKTVNGQIEKNIEDNIKPRLKAYLRENPEQAIILKSVPYKNLISVYKDSDAGITSNNSWLFNTVILLNCTIIIMIVLAYIIIKKSCGICVDIVDLLKFNFTAFFFIGLIEITFFYFIASKFDPIKPSIFISSFIDKLKTVIR